MVDAKTAALGHVGVAISFGLVIMAMIYAFGHISGAHLNPAVSFAFALTRHFPSRRVAGYWLAQVQRAGRRGDLHGLWLYLVAPLLGAAGGGLAYQFVRGERA